MRGSTCLPQRGKRTYVKPSRSGEGEAGRRGGKFRDEREMIDHGCGAKNMRWRKRRDNWQLWHDKRPSQVTKHAVAAALSRGDCPRRGLAVTGQGGSVLVACGSCVSCGRNHRRRGQRHNHRHRTGDGQPNDHPHQQYFFE